MDDDERIAAAWRLEHDLAPCRFCQAETPQLIPPGDGRSAAWVRCRTCGACGPLIDRGDDRAHRAAVAWNEGL